MNKNKLYWSTMGIEPFDKSVKQNKFNEFEKQLKIMFNMFDKIEVLSLVRKVYENEN